MNREVALFFLYQAFGGGSTSFTVHLFKAFEEAGITPHIYRVRERGEETERPFTGYRGVTYRNINVKEALRIAKNVPSLLTAAAHSKHLAFEPKLVRQLARRGMVTVAHDPNEFKVYDHLPFVKKKGYPVICIRPTMQEFIKHATFIHHPYVRYTEPKHWTPPDLRPHLAVSIARVTFVKRTHMILEVNRLMEHERNHVILRGAENRLYTKHVLSKRYPEYEQGKTGYPMEWGYSVIEAEKGIFALDFTYFPDDGGGSQYSFMEAWDAGTVNIIHKDWLRYPGEMHAHPTDRAKGNCIAVSGPQEASDWLRLYRQSRRWRDDAIEVAHNGYCMLRKHHDPVKVAEQYWSKLNDG